MKFTKNKIVVTGGNGRFASTLKDKSKDLHLIFANKKELNILEINSIKKFLKKNKPSIVLHSAGLTRPMSLHDKEISKSIDLNIIGTANVVKVCSDLNIKLIYLSTGYLYPGDKGNYKETDPLKPWNNYGWSKLGGESAVQMYKKSLILRITMTEKPFVHKKAFTNYISNFIFHEKIVEILPYLINCYGVINVGGKKQSVYNFAKKYNPNIKKQSATGLIKKLNTSMDIRKLKNLLKIKKKNIILS